MAKTNTQSKKTKPYYERPNVLRRVVRVYERALLGETNVSIALREKVSTATITKDIVRAREISLALAAGEIDFLSHEAVERRFATLRKIHRSIDDADEEDASGRASLFREVRENLTAIEELQSLRNEDSGTRPEAVILFRLESDKSPRTLDELSTERLLALKAELAQPTEDIIEGQGRHVD